DRASPAAADGRRLGRRLVRVDEDARRPRGGPAPPAGRRRSGVALHPHRARRRIPVLVARGARRVTLRRRLLLAFAYLLVLIVVALAIPLGVTVDRRAKDAFYARVSAQGQVIATSLGDSGKLDGDLPGLRQKVRVYGSNIDARVIVTGGSDKALLLADSDDAQAPPETSYNTPGRPEIAAALRGQSVRLV